MKKILITFVILFIQLPLFCQSFQLPGDGKWYRVATIGGLHGYIKYRYSHATAHNPSFSYGEFIFINARGHAVQEHHAMGYQTWNQPQFAVINYGNNTELWVKASQGVNPGTFVVTEFMNLSINLADMSDADLSDNGGSLKVYDKIRDESHTYIGNFIVADGNVGIGKSPDASAKLDVAGTIRATEIKVEAQTADFVFDDNYALRDLKEVESFITQHKHLPDIPSAAQMEADGVNLAEMNKLLLQKIEELTLYLLVQQKTIDAQGEEILQKETNINKLQTEIQALADRFRQMETILTKVNTLNQ